VFALIGTTTERAVEIINKQIKTLDNVPIAFMLFSSYIFNIISTQKRVFD
jgi:hypothetical protein